MAEHKKAFWGATLYTGAQAGFKAGINFLMGKAAALLLGPAGLGILGQFQSILFIAQSLGNASLQNGLVRYLSGEDELRKRRQYIRTAFTVSIAGSLLTGLILLLLAPWLNNRYLHLEHYWVVFVMLAVSTVFNSLILLLAAFVNARKAYKALAGLNMLQTLLTAILFLPLLYYRRLWGAMAALVLVQIPVFFIGKWWLRKLLRADFGEMKPGFDTMPAKRLAGFSIMTLLGILSFSMMQVVVRDRLLQAAGANAVGYWEGIIRIGNLYLMFINLIFASYLMPRYAESRSTGDLMAQLRFNALRIVPLAGLIIGGILLTRQWLIPLLLSKEFLNMQDAMLWQMLGDFLRIAAFLFSHLLVSQRKIPWVITCDAVFHFGIIAMVCFGWDSLILTTQANLIAAVVYLLLLAGGTMYLRQKGRLLERR